MLHLNPSSETKSRGHLGSQLERKAETNLRIEKKDSVSIIYSDRNRGADIPKDTAPRFVWSVEHQMHVSTDTIGNIKASAKLEELREQCREAFEIAGKTALTWTDFVASAKRVPGVKSQRSAERIGVEFWRGFDGRAAQGDINGISIRTGVDAARPFPDRNGGHDLKIAAADDGKVAGFFVGDENLVATVCLAVGRNAQARTIPLKNAARERR